MAAGRPPATLRVAMAGAAGDLRAELAFAHRLADLAARVTLPRFGGRLDATRKADATAVTASDVDAEATIRDAIADAGKVAIGRLVLTTREHMIALEPRGKGLMGTLLRYPYEVRDEADYFEDIPNLKVDKEALDLAKHIVQTKAKHFKPERFEDRYESALRGLIAKKRKGEKIEAPKPERPSNVVSLMDALRRSVQTERRSSRRRTPRRAAAHRGRASAKRAHTRRRTA